jgi:hypothetical protein
MKNKIKFAVIFLIMCAVMLTPITAHAVDLPDISTPTDTVPQATKPTDIPFIEEPIDEPPVNSSTPEGAAPPHTATGDLIANDFVFEDGQTGKQFATFKTASGKVFYLIIDHDKATDNVYLLTEVGENDLLNLTQIDTNGSGESSAVILPTNPGTTSDPTTPAQPVPPQSGSSGLIIIVIVVLGIGGGALYYFKFRKGKPFSKAQDFDFDDEDEYPEDTEDASDDDTEEDE